MGYSVRCDLSLQYDRKDFDVCEREGDRYVIRESDFKSKSSWADRHIFKWVNAQLFDKGGNLS